MSMSPIPAQGTAPVFPWPSPKLVRRTRASITAASRTATEKSLLSLTSQPKVNLSFSAARQSPGPPPAQRDTCPDPVLSVSFQFSNSSPVTRNTEVSDASGTGLPTQTRNSSLKDTPCSVHSFNQVEDHPRRALKMPVDSGSISTGPEGPLSRLQLQ